MARPLPSQVGIPGWQGAARARWPRSLNWSFVTWAWITTKPCSPSMAGAHSPLGACLLSFDQSPRTALLYRVERGSTHRSRLASPSLDPAGSCRSHLRGATKRCTKLFSQLTPVTKRTGLWTRLSALGGDLAMQWLYIAAAGAGALVGLLWLRVLVVVAGSVVLVGISVVWMTLQQWPLLGAAINVFALLATLQFCYLVALMLSSAWTRVASRGSFDASTRRM